MRLSFIGFLSILLLICTIHVSEARRWGGARYGRCRGQYERYAECATTCPDTCDDIRRPNPMKICNLMCRMGCECIQPFVRLNQNLMSPCIHPSQCPYY